MGGAGEQVQISIDPGAKFDFDSQVADLRSDVAKIKQVREGGCHPHLLTPGPSMPRRCQPRQGSAGGCSSLVHAGPPCSRNDPPTHIPLAQATLQLAYAIDDERKLAGQEIDSLVSPPRALTALWLQTAA